MNALMNEFAWNRKWVRILFVIQTMRIKKKTKEATVSS